MVLYVDSREPSQVQNMAVAAADERGLDAEIKELDSGDFVVGDVAIERKEAGDLNSSITDQRIFEQTTRMAADFNQQYVIVEGDPYQEKRGPSNSSIAATMASISHKKGVHIIYTPDHIQTCKVVAKIAEYVESDEEFDIDEETLQRTSVETDSFLVHTLSGIEGVSPAKARVIEEEVCGSVLELVHCDPDEFTVVDGVGHTLSNRIHDEIRNW